MSDNNHPLTVACHAAGLTLKEFGKIIGWGERKIQYFTGSQRRMTPVEQMRAARILGCEPSDLDDPKAPDHNVLTSTRDRPWKAGLSPHSTAVDRMKRLQNMKESPA